MSKSEWTGWRAIIAPTDVGDTFGIFWQNAPAMERRGGYSGPYKTREDAEASAISWRDSWDMTDADLEIVHQDIHP